METENNIQVFDNDQFGFVRTVIKDGDPWFVAVDVCRALDIDATATRRLDQDEKSALRLTQTSSNGTEQVRDVTLKAYKYRIYPNTEQEKLIQRTFGCCRFVYNQTLAYRKNLYETEKKSMSILDCSSYARVLKRERSCKIYCVNSQSMVQ